MLRVPERQRNAPAKAKSLMNGHRPALTPPAEGGPARRAWNISTKHRQRLQRQAAAARSGAIMGCSTCSGKRSMVVLPPSRANLVPDGPRHCTHATAIRSEHAGTTALRINASGLPVERGQQRAVCWSARKRQAPDDNRYTRADAHCRGLTW